MKVNVEDVSSVKKTLHIEVPEKTVVEELDGAYLQLKKNAKVKGFRPGKAPRSVLERIYGKDVRADVQSRLIQSSFANAIKETELKIIGSPKVDPPEFEGKGDYAYDATVEVRPDLEDIEIKGLDLTRTNYTAGDDEIDIQLQALQKNMAKTEKIEEDRPAAKDDFVVVDYEGFKEGEAFPETALTENFTLKIGEGHIAEAFDEKLIGMNAGEDREIKVDFPDDYFNEKLQGLSIDFKVKLHEIKAENLPELDDAFAKSLGPFETLEDLKNVIKDNLTQGYEKRIEQEMNENPLLEQQDVDPNTPEESDEELPSKDTRSEDEKELVVDNEHDNQEDFERLQNMISDLPNTFDDSFKRSANRVQEDADRRHPLVAGDVT